MDTLNYAGFWLRVGASLVDTLIFVAVLAPALTLVYGTGYWTDAEAVAGPWDIVLNYLMPAVVTVLFWMYKSATPGKMAIKLIIVDAESGGKPSSRQLLVRYLGYFVSTLPLCLGLIWVAIDKRKQGWHDKMAGTLVVRQAPAVSLLV